MKQIYVLLLLSLVVFGCYDDKGNYDYIELGEVTIELSGTSFSRQVGESLQITPTVTTDIPEEDLIYVWECNVDTAGVWYEYFITVQEGKDLDYVLSEELFTEEGTYDFRLNITQESTGRHFYSDAVEVSVTLEPSLLGLMVLHGDGISSDIGMIVAEEFYWSVPTETVEAQVYPAYYSEANGGEKIAGRGQQVIESDLSSGPVDYITVIALTDESSTVAYPKTMVKQGEWNDLFAGGLNENVPRGLAVVTSNLYAFDGDDIFTRQGFGASFTTPCYDPEMTEEGVYAFYPNVWDGEGSIQMVLFDELSRGFVSVGQSYSFSRLSLMNAAGGSSVPVFNPADMQADLVFMSRGGIANHLMAVMQNDAGEYFLIDMNIGASGFEGVPQYRYDLSGWSDVQSGKAIDWAFGENYINMCFYATADGVYQFAVDNGQISSAPAKLRMQDNSEVAFEGEITMMKLLNPTVNGGGYYMANTEMVVGTYGGAAGTGILYSLELEPWSGRVISVKEYTGFDEIYDVDIKTY